MTNPNKMLPRELGWLTSLLALGLVISCADETTFDPSAPASGPGELVGRDEPLNQSFQGGASPDIDARAVAEPDWQVCDAECQAYCAAQPFANPIDEAICPALWGAGFDTLDVNAGQACRRLYADLKGRFPSLAEVQADCEGQPIADVALRLLKQDSFVHVHQRRYADTLRTSVYRRVDIGFSKQLLGAKGQEKTNWLRNINDLWVTLEVFNLLDINNTIDHTWITDVSGRQYSIPDYLTPRRFNLKVMAWF